MPPRSSETGLLKLALLAMGVHSVTLGLITYLFTDRFLRRMGLNLSSHRFYPRQSGVFLLVLGTGYLLAARDPAANRGLVSLTVLSKAVAVLFLFSEFLVRKAPRSVLIAGTMDGLMGAAIVALARDSYRRVESTEPEV
jgi:uncharacterized membrane protein